MSGSPQNHKTFEANYGSNNNQSFNLNQQFIAGKWVRLWYSMVINASIK